MPLQPPKRFIRDDNTVNPEADLRELSTQLHASYTHWVARNWHQRDFVCAVEHAADYALSVYLMEGSPDFAGEELPALAPTTLAAPVAPSHSAPVRLYDELSSLSPEIDTKALDRVLAAHFIRWVMEGWLARDFKQAASSCASAILYDHHLCSQLGGLGGCRSALEFLSEPYRFPTPAPVSPQSR
jgi:hypothetical protein